MAAVTVTRPIGRFPSGRPRPGHLTHPSQPPAPHHRRRRRRARADRSLRPCHLQRQRLMTGRPLPVRPEVWTGPGVA